MRYNPCGYIVDWVRVPYRQQCRFFRDDDRINTVRWAEANPDALTLPFPSVICNSENEVDHYSDAPVGEVFGARRPYTGQTAPVGLFSGHFCGTEEDFIEGGKYEPEKPPVPYSASGFPLCCGVLPVTRGGGGVAGLATWIVGSMKDPTEGGMEIGGEVGDKLGFTDATDGGLEIGGEVYDVFTPPDPTYPEQYIIEEPAVTVSSTNTGGVDDRIWVDPLITWWLYSPPQTGTNWLLHEVATGTEWAPLGTWDGTGSRVFSELGGLSTRTVSEV